MAFTLVRQGPKGVSEVEGLTEARARMFASMFLVDNGLGRRRDVDPHVRRAARGERVSVTHPTTGETYTIEIRREVRQRPPLSPRSARSTS